MPDLSETDPELIKKLQALMDIYGPERVRATVQQMIGQMLMSAAGLVDTPAEKPLTLTQDLTRVINRHSVENGSNTPDFLLAEYLVRCLQSAQMLINRRTGWWGLPDTFEKLTGQDKPLEP